MKKIFYIFTILFFVYPSFYGQTNIATKKTDKIIADHPQWILQGNIYEVNTRQYTPEGTLNAFAKHLNRLKDMGVQTLWFMPINPISKVDRKGSLGSYYAVADYTAINPEFGTMNDFIHLVKLAHEKNMKVIIDWVPNHTGADNRWLTEHPDFFVKDANGNAAIAQDWVDTRQLDYKNIVMQDSMINAMKFWIKKADIDGFRCDVAWNVPFLFWKRAIAELKQMKPLFMLAEGDNSYLAESGFDAVYPWNMFKMMEKIAKGKRPAFSLDSIKKENDAKFPKNTIQMYFTSNHDENSWNQADYGSFPGAIHAPFAVFTQTMANSVPLIYSGQEEPILRAIKFFDKDTLNFSKFKRAPFYKILLNLRTRNNALSAEASFRKVIVGDPKAVYAYVRENGNNKVFVILNFSNKEQFIKINDSTLFGDPLNVFEGKRELLNNKLKTIKPWGYEVYEFVSK